MQPNYSLGLQHAGCARSAAWAPVARPFLWQWQGHSCCRVHTVWEAPDHHLQRRVDGRLLLCVLRSCPRVPMRCSACDCHALNKDARCCCCAGAAALAALVAALFIRRRRRGRKSSSHTKSTHDTWLPNFASGGGAAAASSAGRSSDPARQLLGVHSTPGAASSGDAARWAVRGEVAQALHSVCRKHLVA